MTGHHGGLEVVAETQCRDDAVKEDGRLCDLGLLKLIVGSGKHHVGDLEAEDLVGLIKELLSQCVVVVEVLAHAYEL